MHAALGISTPEKLLRTKKCPTPQVGLQAAVSFGRPDLAKDSRLTNHQGPTMSDLAGLP